MFPISNWSLPLIINSVPSTFTLKLLLDTLKPEPSNAEAFTATSSVLTVIPSPAPVLIVSAPVVQPPVKPAPAVTPVISPLSKLLKSTV